MLLRFRVAAATRRSGFANRADGEACFTTPTGPIGDSYRMHRASQDVCDYVSRKAKILSRTFHAVEFGNWAFTCCPGMRRRSDDSRSLTCQPRSAHVGVS